MKIIEVKEKGKLPRLAYKDLKENENNFKSGDEIEDCNYPGEKFIFLSIGEDSGGKYIKCIKGDVFRYLHLDACRKTKYQLKIEKLEKFKDKQIKKALKDESKRSKKSKKSKKTKNSRN